MTSPICPCFYNLEKGSSSCKVRPACTDKDYFYTHTACDANGEVGSMVLEPLGPQIAPLPTPWALLHLGFQKSVELAGRKSHRPLWGLQGLGGGVGRQSEMASFIFRSETVFAPFVPLLIHTCSVAKKPLHFLLLGFSHSLGASGPWCSYFLMELIRPVPSALLLSAGKGNSFPFPVSLENGLTVLSLLVPSFPQAFCLRESFLCSLRHL